MSRLVWVAVGAAGGILAYRKATKVYDDARGRGLVGNVNAATTSATHAASVIRTAVRGTEDAIAQRAARRSQAQDPGSLSGWTPPTSDDDSSTTSPNADTPSSPQPH